MSDCPSASLREAYALLREDLRRFLRARTGDPADADELMQDLWLRISQDSRGEVVNPRAYLYRAAQNLVLDRVRRRARQAERETAWAAINVVEGGEGAEDGPSALDSLLDRERLAALSRAIERLPEGAGRAFRLHKLEGLPHAEVAARLGISRSGVEKHIAVAMAHLRRAMYN